MTTMPRPSAEQLGLLTRFERAAFEIADFVNRNPIAKKLGHAYLNVVGVSYVHLMTRGLLHVGGLEHVRALEPERGVIFMANHRTAADLYVTACVLLKNTKWISQLYFPVKSEYYYERSRGVLVNGLASAWAMYPPVMRRQEARAFNDYTVQTLSEVLLHKGTAVGFHPEGTRSKLPDPYEILPFRPGIGQIAYRAQPLVVPTVILGLDDLNKQAKHQLWSGDGEPITVLFGKPVDLSSFYAEPPRLRTYKGLSDHLHGVMLQLLSEEREFRRARGLPPPKPNTV